MSTVFDVRDEWDVVIRQFDNREDAEEFIRQRGQDRFHIMEGD